MTDAQRDQAAVCARFGAALLLPSTNDKVGIALESLHSRPLHALRHSPGNGTCGWYIWAGELSEDSDFFSPLHVTHLPEHVPELVPYLGLPPGWRVLIAPGHEDVWYEEAIRGVHG